MFHLTAKSGAAKGRTWSLTNSGMVIGRDMGCDIWINDPLISRRHCMVHPHPEGIRVEDLGSSNATLINGDPVVQGLVRPGDEITLGNVILLVTQLEGLESQAFSAPVEQPTSSLAWGKPIFIEEDSEKLFSKGRPRTVEEMAELLRLGRTLSQCHSISGCITLLLERLTDAFAPNSMWILLKRAQQNEPVVFPPGATDEWRRDSEIHENITRLFARPRGILLPQRVSKNGLKCVATTVMAPMVMGDEVAGIIVIRTESPGRIYDESDLEMLLAIAHTVAPYIKAVERLEQLRLENQRLATRIPNAVALVGNSPPMTRLRETITSCARSNLNVMVLGETGTGKELVAHMIHNLSERSDRDLIVVNCAAIPDELFESEVFGHVRGAFTGAHTERRGLMEESDVSTLFLDEVCDLSLANQARLLRAIETGAFRRLGGKETIRVNVRVLSATNKFVAEEVARGTFRRDLYHRLNAFEIHMPPLRERIADIPILAEHFLRRAMENHHVSLEGFEPEAMQTLEQREWLGNVRELKNVIERAVVVARYDRIRLEDLHAGASGTVRGDDFPTLETMECEHIQRALELCRGNVSEASKMLGIGRSTLYRKVTAYNLSILARSDFPANS
ncbi:MAG: sigma 54-interacting transcriptional regulator [Candidatus Hydrogenedentes bacterium]|nr:sigma 54-interacting transcriptional regulator [Candidatus Hydrogenedentota bacterium]